MKLTKLFRLESIQLPRFKSTEEFSAIRLKSRTLEFRELPAGGRELDPFDAAHLTITLDAAVGAGLLSVGDEFEIKIKRYVSPEDEEKGDAATLKALKDIPLARAGKSVFQDSGPLQAEMKEDPVSPRSLRQDEEIRLLSNFRRFKARSNPGDVFKWETSPLPLLVHDPQEVSRT